MKNSLLSLILLGFVSAASAQVICYVETPPPLVGNKEMTWADPGGGWGCPDLNNPANSILDMLVFVDDGTAGDSLGCNALVNGSQIAGHIAVVYRGSCEFGTKALNAETAGAIGVVIINNIPGSPVGMGPGVNGASVTIPVVMITQADGAALKAQIDAGNVTAFIGNKLYYYPNDIGMWPRDYIVSPASSNPRLTNQNDTEFSARYGSWVFNYGQNNQANIALTTTVTYGGTPLYTQTSSPFSLNSGDSMWVMMPTFSQPNYNPGLYKVTYSMSSDSTDDFPADNWRRSDFTISDSLFSYAALDTNTLMPISSAHYRPSAATGDFESCLVFRDSVASRLKAEGIYFSATTNAADSLTGSYVETVLYQWDDVFVDVNDAGLGFSSLTDVAYGGYTYSSDLQGQTVYAPFSAEYPLLDNQRYLFCVKEIFGDIDIYIGYGTAIDYDEHINEYLQPVTPIGDGGTWYWAGFGTDVVPSLGVKLTANTIGIEDETGMSVDPAYPNPTTSGMVYIPLNGLSGTVEIAVMDLQGRILKSEIRTLPNNNALPVNLDGVSNGQYIIRLTMESGAVQSFKILVNQ